MKAITSTLATVSDGYKSTMDAAAAIIPITRYIVIV